MIFRLPSIERICSSWMWMRSICWIVSLPSSSLCHSSKTTNSVWCDLSVLWLCSSTVHWPMALTVVWLYSDNTYVVLSSFTRPRQPLIVSADTTWQDAVSGQHWLLWRFILETWHLCRLQIYTWSFVVIHVRFVVSEGVHGWSNLFSFANGHKVVWFVVDWAFLTECQTLLIMFCATMGTFEVLSFWRFCISPTFFWGGFFPSPWLQRALMESATSIFLSCSETLHASNISLDIDRLIWGALLTVLSCKFRK